MKVQFIRCLIKNHVDWMIRVCAGAGSEGSSVETTIQCVLQRAQL